MPLYTISRYVDASLPESELEALLGRAIASTKYYPGVRWQRSYQWAGDEELYSLCVYEAPSPAAIQAHSMRCAIPFSEIREVREYAPNPRSGPAEGGSLYILTAELGPRVDGHAIRTVVSDTTEAFEDGSDMRWVRTFWDRELPHARRVVAASDEAALRRHLESSSTHYEVQTVSEALPSEWAEWFDALGLPRHWELHDPIEAGPEPAYVQ